MLTVTQHQTIDFISGFIADVGAEAENVQKFLGFLPLLRISRHTYKFLRVRRNLRPSLGLFFCQIDLSNIDVPCCGPDPFPVYPGISCGEHSNGRCE